MTGRGTAKDAKDGADIKDIKELAKLLENFKRDMRTELRDIKESVDFCSDACDSVKNISKDIAALRDEIRELTKQNSALKAENVMLSQRLEELEQYQRINNLEIKGVPEGNDPMKVLMKIGEVVGETIQEDDIDACHWVPTLKTGERNVVVRFVRRNKRNNLLAKARKLRLNATTLGLEGSTSIFVNEHLTQQNKKLLAAARQKKKAANWKFIWTSGGKIFARKYDSSPVVRIATFDDLVKICNGE